MATQTELKTSGNVAAATPKPAAPKTVAEDMANRRVFTTTRNDKGEVEKTAVEQAQEYLDASAESFADFAEQVFATPGIGEDEDGNAVWDADIYTDSTDVMVSILRKQKGGVKAVVVAPVPSIDSILADESGRAWAERILHKELNHVAVRALREAEDVSTVVDQMPVNMTGYIESGRAGSGITETFNELYKQINATLAAKLPVWAKYRLIKTELKKAMESKGYAAEVYAPLEDYKGDSLFVAAIKMGINAAKRKGLDPTIFERWLATRDQKVYDAAKPEGDDDDFDFDSLADSMLVDEGKPDEATVEAKDDEATEANTAPDAAVTDEAPAADSTDAAAEPKADAAKA